MRSFLVSPLPLLALCAVALTACDQSTPVALEAPPPLFSAHEYDGGHNHAATLAPEDRQALAQLRRATAPFHDLQTAMEAGWNAAITPCLEDPAGGMGVHMANLSLFDDVVEETLPETLVYEPRQNGTMRLVAVEFIVPFSARGPDEEAPEAFGQTFHADEAVGIWALHVWIWRQNPNGLFADWNPKVTCEHAS